MYKFRKCKALNIFVVFAMLLSYVAIPNTNAKAETNEAVEIFKESFSGNKTKVEVGTDWVLNPENLAGYDSTGNFGEGAPSAKLDGSGKYIETPSFSLATEGKLSLWIKGQSGIVNSKLEIKVLANNEWVVNNTLTVEDSTLPTSGSVLEFTIPKEATKIRLEYTKDKSNVAVDDIKLIGIPAGSAIPIAEARKSTEAVKIKGIVTFKEASGASFNYAIQDGTAGIAIRGTDDLNLGDEVTVEGAPVQYNSLTQITYSSLTKNSSGNALPEPKDVKIADIIDSNGGENYESQRIKFSTVTLGKVESKGNTVITDSEGKSVNIYKVPALTSVKEGDKVDIIGICSQYDKNNIAYQIRVASADDVTISKDIPVEEDTVGPEINVISPSGVTTTNKKTNIKVGYTDKSSIDKNTVKIFVDDVDVTAKSEITDEYVSYTPESELEVKKHTVKVVASDLKGNNSEITFEFEVKEKESNGTLVPYFGQLHSHTTNSDGVGSLDDAFSYAKNKAGVDFLAVTDHSNSFDNDTTSSMADGSTSTKWNNGKAAATKYTDDSFVGIYAYEMTWSNGIGHMNTFNTPGFESRNKPEFKATNALQTYYDTLKKFPASLSQLNHPGKTFGDFNDFASYDKEIDKLITLIEVGNGEGAVRGSGYFPSYEYYTRALDKGWHVAPTNNQDNHKGKWGDANTAKTVILADSLTEENIYDALRNMRTYATEDENLEIMYTLNDEIMGTILDQKPSEVKLKVNLKDPDSESIGKVSVIVNGGKTVDSKTVSGSEDTVEFTLPSDYSYYYIRVDQSDKDIAVTAPVWIGEVEKAGIAKSSTSTTMPIKGEEFAINTSFFNNENSPLTVNSIQYSIDGAEINKTETPIIVNSLGTDSYSFKYTAPKAGSYNIAVKASATLNGVEKVFTDVLKIVVSDPAVVSKVVIDGTHFNDYVAGYYANNMGNFTAIANGENVAVNIEKDKITDKLLEDADLLVVTAPAKKTANANGVSYTPQSFSDEFIQTVKRYADSGGNIIVCGIADYQDGTGEYASSTQLNKLLEAIGVTTRINNDEVVDDVNNGGQKFRLAFKNYNKESEFLKDVVDSQVYSFYSGCSVDLNEDAVKAGKSTWLVKGFDTTYSFDSNKNTTGTAVPKGEVVALATEKLSGGGNIFLGGTVFVSDFEVKASLDNYNDLQYTNYNIAMNILDTIKKEIPVTPIKEVRNGAEGDVYSVEGTVTAGTQPGNAFFDTIYIQDDTAGINIFPVSGIDLKVGQKVRIIGSVSQYEGEKQLNLSNIELIDSSINQLEPTKISTKEATEEKNKGTLVSVTGEVKEIGENNQEYMILNDGSGDVRVFLNGYVGASDGSIEVGKFNSNIKVGSKVTAVGLASTDTNGARIRVRDSLEVVSKTKEITILHTNDSHGRVKAEGSVIGIDTIAAIKDSYENALLVDAGDTLHGLPFATLNSGADIVNLMKMAGYDLMAPGNHDFNYGYERLLELASLASSGENGFDIISANVLKDGKSILKANEIKDINGVKVGFFGLSTPETAYKTNPNNVNGIQFQDPVKSAREQVESLKEQGADIIIALAHIGTDESSEVQSTMIADAVEGIDIIIDGHSHSTFKDGLKAGNGTLIVSTGEYEANIGKVTLTIDTETNKVEEKSAALISKAEASNYTADQAVKEEIAKIDAEQGKVLSEVVGMSSVDLDGERANVRTKETNLANLITDSMLFETGADIAITNGGGIRASIPKGEITKKEIITVLPFGNFIVTKYLTGEQIKKVLEHGVRSYPASLGGFTQVGGLKFVFDESKPAGSRVIKVTFNGKDLDMNKKYLVATNDFLAAGGDEYPCFGDVRTENEYGALDETLAKYIEHLSVVNYSVENRITRDSLENIQIKEAIEKVVSLIDDIPENVTLNDKAVVVSIRALYDALKEDQKALVTNYEKLLSAENKIKELEKATEENPGNGETPGNGQTPVEEEKPVVNVDPKENKPENKPSTTIPKTGGTDTIYLLALGVILISSGAIVVFKRKRKNEEIN